MINGVIALPIMVVMMLLGSNKQVMGRFIIGKRLRWLGWLATTVMGVAVAAMLATMQERRRGGHLRGRGPCER